MIQTSCIFCDIIAKKLPAHIVEDTTRTVVIEDRFPKAPVHYLIIPKKHIRNCIDLTEEDREWVADILYTAQRVARTLRACKDFRLIMNNGAEAGQSVFHMHMHLIAGKQFTDF